MSIDGPIVRALLETDPGTLGQEARQMLRADVLRQVFHGRACVIISMAPKSWSAVDELPGRSELRPPSHRFPVFALATDAASHELLSFVGRSEDFERGYCWVVTVESGRPDLDGPLLDWLVGGLPTPGPVPELEVLSMDTDGEEISWTSAASAEARAEKLRRWLPSASNPHKIDDETAGPDARRR